MRGWVITVCCGLALGCLLALGACKPEQENPYPGADKFGPQLIENERAACLKAGGRFDTGGITGSLVCYKTPPDAGKSCRKESDCSTLCLARSQTCAPIEPLFGCNEILTDGGARVTLCVD